MFLCKMNLFVKTIVVDIYFTTAYRPNSSLRDQPTQPFRRHAAAFVTLRSYTKSRPRFNVFSPGLINLSAQPRTHARTLELSSPALSAAINVATGTHIVEASLPGGVPVAVRDMMAPIPTANSRPKHPRRLFLFASAFFFSVSNRTCFKPILSILFPFDSGIHQTRPYVV